MVDGFSAVPEGGVFCFAFAGFDLESGLDDIARGGQIRRGHACNCTCGQQLQDTQLLVRTFSEKVSLQVIVCWEVNSRKGDVAEQAGGSAFVKADETKILDYPHCGAPGSPIDGFGDFALHLETDLDDFEWVGEDLDTGQYYSQGSGCR